MFKRVTLAGTVLLALALAMVIAGPSWAGTGAGYLKKHPVTDITKGPDYVDGQVLLVMNPGASAKSVRSIMNGLAGKGGYSAKHLNSSRTKTRYPG